MTEIQERLLALFKYTIDFLDKNNLKYVACGGTVLGAVRHKGFIPWDDDVDIYMFREDYNKLLSLRKTLQKDDHDIISLPDEGYYLPFAKIIDAKTTVWEYKEFPFIQGLFIDVFPLDCFDIPDQDVLRIQNRSRNLLKLLWVAMGDYTLSDVFNNLMHPRFVVDYIYSHIFVRRSSYFVNKYLKNESTYTGGNGNTTLCMSQWKGRLFKKEWFLDAIDYPFEHLTIKIPSHYSEYLTMLYGDYMKLPPEEKRKGGHFAYYMNLNERLSLEEVKRIIQNDQKYQKK